MHLARISTGLMAAGLAFTTAFATPSLANTFEGCGWYAVFACSKSEAVAIRAAGNGFLVVRTDDYPNFRNGYWCAVDGPFDRLTATSSVTIAKESGISDAYIKQGCR